MLSALRIIFVGMVGSYEAKGIRVIRERSFQNSLEMYEFPTSLGVYRGVIISK